MKKYLVLVFIFFVSASSLFASNPLLLKVTKKLNPPQHHTLFSQGLTGEMELILDNDNNDIVTRPVVRVGNKILLGYESEDVKRVCVTDQKGKKCVLPDFTHEDEGLVLVYLNRGDVILNKKMPVTSFLLAPEGVVSNLEDTFVVVDGKKLDVTIVKDDATAYSRHEYFLKAADNAKNFPVGTPLFGTYVDKETGHKSGIVLLGFKGDAEDGAFVFWNVKSNNVQITDFRDLEYRIENEEELKEIYDLKTKGEEMNDTYEKMN